MHSFTCWYFRDLYEQVQSCVPCHRGQLLLHFWQNEGRHTMSTYWRWVQRCSMCWRKLRGELQYKHSKEPYSTPLVVMLWTDMHTIILNGLFVAMYCSNSVSVWCPSVLFCLLTSSHQHCYINYCYCTSISIYVHTYIGHWLWWRSWLRCQGWCVPGV